MKKSNNADFIGQKFGKLTVVEALDDMSFGKAITPYKGFRCRCRCGGEVYRRKIDLLRLYRQGCIKCKVATSQKLRHEQSQSELIGIKTLGFTVLAFHGWHDRKGGYREPLYKCKCKLCKNIFTMSNSLIRRAISHPQRFTTCGCKRYYKMKSTKRSLKDEDVKQIRELYKAKIYKQRELASMFGVNERVISYVVHNKGYQEI